MSLFTATAPNFSSVVAMRRFWGASASSQMYETVAFRQPFGQALVPILHFIIFVQFFVINKNHKNTNNQLFNDFCIDFFITFASLLI